MLITSVYSIVDGIVASNYVSNEAFASVNIVYHVVVTVIAIRSMTGIGTTAIIPAKMWMNKKEEAKVKGSGKKLLKAIEYIAI